MNMTNSKLRILFDYLYNEKYHSSELINRCENDLKDKDYPNSKEALREVISANIRNCQKMDKIIDMIIDFIEEKK